MSERATSYCRCCHSEDMLMFLPLGLHGPAQGFLKLSQIDDETLFELNTHACLQCGLIQVPNRIPPDFFRHYLYVPSTATQMHKHFGDLAGLLKERFLTASGNLFVDVGCNDGLLLKAAHDIGCKTLGIDPAENIGQLAKDKGLDVISEYFSPEIAKIARDQYGAATVITSNNTFNHIDDLDNFMQGVKILLADNGVFVVEVPQAIEYMNKLMFDNIYHEHLSVFSVKSLKDLYARFDMEIFDIDPLSVQGGSMRVYARHRQDGATQPAKIGVWLEKERQIGLLDRDAYARYKAKVETIRDELLEILRDIKAQGKKVIGYGAAAKGNTLLNYYQIGSDTLDFIADKNQLKHGMYSPGMHIPVVSTDEIARAKPDYMLILAWNLADEIMAQQSDFKAGGGRFIIPFPKPVII